MRQFYHFRVFNIYFWYYNFNLLLIFLTITLFFFFLHHVCIGLIFFFKGVQEVSATAYFNKRRRFNVLRRSKLVIWSKILPYQLMHCEFKFQIQFSTWFPTPQIGQTHSNNLSDIFQNTLRQIVWVCLTILWFWRLKG